MKTAKSHQALGNPLSYQSICLGLLRKFARRRELSRVSESHVPDNLESVKMSKCDNGRGSTASINNPRSLLLYCFLQVLFLWDLIHIPWKFWFLWEADRERPDIYTNKVHSFRFKPGWSWNRETQSRSPMCVAGIAWATTAVLWVGVIRKLDIRPQDSNMAHLHQCLSFFKVVNCVGFVIPIRLFSHHFWFSAISFHHSERKCCAH